MKGIIPTGGRGTRMRPITFSANKHFVPIANKPLIFYPIEAVAGAGIKDIAITYNPGYLDLVKKYLGTGEKWSVKFTYVLQPEAKGLANVVEVCEEFIGHDKFVYHLGDNIFTGGITDLVTKFERSKAKGLIARIKHPENARMGVPYFDSKGRLIKYVEKPKHPPHQWAVPGVYFFDPVVFECFRGKDKILPSARGELEIPSPYQWLLNHNYEVTVEEYPYKWLDPGKFDDWLETNRYILDQKIKEEIYPGLVEKGKKTKTENSTLIGPVSIGDNVTIKNSYIGPYTSIANGCYLDSVRIENSVLMEGVRLEHIPQPVDTSLIGPGSVITGGQNQPHSSQFFVGELNQIRL